MDEKAISLREASRMENPKEVDRKKCRCQGPWSKNCCFFVVFFFFFFCLFVVVVFVKNNLKCSSHCHPSKTCRNVEIKPFIKINLQQRKTVSDGKELKDKHMLAAQQLLKKRFPSNHGFRDTLTLATKCAPEETPYIQIVHVKNNHWIAISASNSAGPVEVYGSLNATKLSEQTLK